MSSSFTVKSHYVHRSGLSTNWKVSGSTPGLSCVRVKVSLGKEQNTEWPPVHP